MIEVRIAREMRGAESKGCTMQWIADFLTVLRILTTLVMVWVGLTLPREQGLAILVWLTIFAWTTDWLDGPIARRAGKTEASWFARHDFEVDLSVGLAQGLAMAAWGAWLPLALAMLFFAGWIAWHAWKSQQAGKVLWRGVWPNHSRTVAHSFLLQVPIGILFIGFAIYVWSHDPILLIPFVGWLVISTALHPRRVWQRVRNFFLSGWALLSGSSETSHQNGS
jgi:phosphatidylglycerophosphate synthase